jgi:hypothetical protein
MGRRKIEIQPITASALFYPLNFYSVNKLCAILVSALNIIPTTYYSNGRVNGTTFDFGHT